MSEDSHPDFSLLREEVKALRLMTMLIVMFVLVALMFGNLLAVFQVPKMVKVFEEMLGDLRKLPTLTHWVISYSRLGGWMLPYALMIVVPVSTCVTYVLFRKTLWAQVFAALVILFLIFHWVIVALAIQSPLLQIMQGINQRG
ncbi:hypothetical protein DES53_111195 [Roseimicrobium gellanilyticum]|uniref:Uncharacterized protein n=1 Tax=Roseimicrobium gellanilyticum TaxID=748857 RepID=A0A366H978_9BACT|nr:hypothetical protein [Roseimicrobium gellanilyticum]RBP38673.1 hypothetical protein DES53_111195 [Roseimicrobium gellanilyticum]